LFGIFRRPEGTEAQGFNHQQTGDDDDHEYPRKPWLFWVRHEHSFFLPKTLENRKHCKLLTISEIHPAFMGRTIKKRPRPSPYSPPALSRMTDAKQILQPVETLGFVHNSRNGGYLQNIARWCEEHRHSLLHDFGARPSARLSPRHSRIDCAGGTQRQRFQLSWCAECAGEAVALKQDPQN
jgi:hypothetical protein